MTTFFFCLLVFVVVFLVDEMAFLWRADDGPTMNAGLVAL